MYPIPASAYQSSLQPPAPHFVPQMTQPSIPTPPPASTYPGQPPPFPQPMPYAMGGSQAGAVAPAPMNNGQGSLPVSREATNELKFASLFFSC